MSETLDESIDRLGVKIDAVVAERDALRAVADQLEMAVRYLVGDQKCLDRPSRYLCDCEICKVHAALDAYAKLKE